MGWRIEPPLTLSQSRHCLPASQAALLSRYSLVELSTYCSTMVLLHVCASCFFERLSGKGVEGVPKPEGERSSVPRSEGRRSWYYILFTLTSSALMVGLKVASSTFDLKFWICEYVFCKLGTQLTTLSGAKIQLISRPSLPPYSTNSRSILASGWLIVDSLWVNWGWFVLVALLCVLKP